LQVLIGDGNFYWTSNDLIDGSRMIGGKSLTGEDLFICRGLMFGEPTPGKLLSDRCYVSHSNNEHVLEIYDVLQC
jgi:Protein of unknown function (DUF3421)